MSANRILCLAAFGSLSLFTATASGAEVSFVPVRATGTYQVVAPNIIYLPQAEQRVFFDFFVSDWDPDHDGDPRIKVVQVATSIGSYGNSNSPSPLAFPVLTCTTDAQCSAAFEEPGVQCDSLFHSSACQFQSQCCQAFFIDTTRPDWLMAGIDGVWAVDTDSARVGVAINPGMELIDQGMRKYIGSLALDVPASAVGEFTLTFRENETFLHDESNPPLSNIPIDIFTPAKVFIGVPVTTEYRLKPRYFTFNTDSIGSPLAYAVRLASLHHPSRPASGSPYLPADFSAFEGQVRWVGPPANYPMSPSHPQHVFTASSLQCAPHFTDSWSGAALYVFGAEVIPDSVYEVKGFQPNCTDFDTCGWSVGTFATGRWCDVVPPFEFEQIGLQPDVSDISGMVDRFKSSFGAPSKAQSQLQPNIPDPTKKVGFTDISLAVDAFRGYAYPFDGPTSCP